jgi:hypothetical protein
MNYEKGLTGFDSRRPTISSFLLMNGRVLFAPGFVILGPQYPRCTHGYTSGAQPLDFAPPIENRLGPRSFMFRKDEKL